MAKSPFSSPPLVVGRSPSPELHKTNPCTTSFISLRRIHFTHFPLLFYLKSSRHRHLLLPAGLSSCRRRSGHSPLSLCLPPPSSGARQSGTPPAASVADPRPPEHRCPSPSPSSVLCWKEKRGRRREKEVEGTPDSGPHFYKTVQQVLSASKELMWTQMATLKPREILRRKARQH
uniref:Uncharacterized protein n=1 Tax=Oryza glumipatula TaxID=40148 RepID=A0A0E0BAG7_9ORYZ